jgi:cellulose synthase (UDP-forming)
VIWLPYFVASMASVRLISEGRRSAVWTNVYETAMAPTVALAVLAEWVGLSRSAFAVTPKGASSESLNFRLGIAAPHLFLLVLSVAALLNAWWWSAGSYTVDSLVITTFWTLYNIVGLTMAVLVCVERPRHRRSERTDVAVRAAASFWLGEDRTAWVLDLSSVGARLLVPWEADGSREFAVQAPRQSPTLTMVDVGEITGATRWVSEVPEGLVVGFEFVDVSAAHMIGIVRHITDSPAWVRDSREENAVLVGAAARTVTGAARRVRPSLRSEARIPTRGIAELTRDQSTTTVHLEDLSYAGCRIRTREHLVTGERVTIALSDLRPTQSPATVQWTERRGAREVAGLRFDPAPGEEPVVP